MEALSSLEPRGEKGEYYLTDVFRPGHKIQPVLFKNGDPFLGVNDLEQLEEVEKKFSTACLILVYKGNDGVLHGMFVIKKI